MSRIDFSDPSYSLNRRISSFIQWLVEKGKPRETARQTAYGYFNKEIREEKQREMELGFLNKVRMAVDKDEFYEGK